jgi:hypothetical protein
LSLKDNTAAVYSGHRWMMNALENPFYLSLIDPSTRIRLVGIFHGWMLMKYFDHHHALTLRLDHGIKPLDEAVFTARIRQEH